MPTQERAFANSTTAPEPPLRMAQPWHRRVVQSLLYGHKVNR